MLLEPVRVGRAEVRNRIAITCHGFSPRAYDAVQDKYFGYLARRAEGGAGLIIAQAVNVQPVASGRPFRYDVLAPAFTRLARIMHDRGATLLVQLLNVGAKYRSGRNFGLDWIGEPAWGFSAQPTGQAGEVAHEMTGDEVEAMIEGYGRAAELVVSVGIDGVELHGGHGYLLQQSISPWMNRRGDEWGEPLRFWRAVLDRVRVGVGASAIVGARIPSDDLQPADAGGLGPGKLAAIAADLVSLRQLDYLNPTHGSDGSHYSRSIGTYRRPHGEFLADTRRIRQATSAAIPLIGVGRITSIAAAEAALQRGDCDLVGMTRAHIADPDLAAKAARGDVQAIRPCVGANTGCIDRGILGGDMMCFHNPEVGREYRDDLAPRPAAASRRVLVVGGGPAGLTAARTAARRGHRVVLADRGPRLGGRLGTITGPALELTTSVRWLEDQIEQLGVDIHRDTEVDAAYLASAGVDAVIIAAGSRPAGLPFRCDGTVPVLSTDEAALAAAAGRPRSVLVADTLGTDEAAVVTEALAQAGWDVALISVGPVGAFMGATHALDHLPRLRSLGVRIEERSTVESIGSSAVTTRSLLTGTQTRYTPDAVVLAATRVADDGLAATARGLGLDVLLAGDCDAPRDAMFAFIGGHDAGRRV